MAWGVIAGVATGVATAVGAGVGPGVGAGVGSGVGTGDVGTGFASADSASLLAPWTSPYTTLAQVITLVDLRGNIRLRPELRL